MLVFECKYSFGLHQGRAILLRRMQEDLEKKRQQIVEGRVQRDREAEAAEREKAERYFGNFSSCAVGHINSC